MDFHALQHKLFALDPSDPAEDKKRLLAQAQGNFSEAPTTKDYVNESIEVPKGSMPIDLDLGGLAALAGVTLNETQKMGPAGQAKGKDPMPKAKRGRTKHPLKDKLVGEEEIDEAPQGFKAGFQGYNKVDPWRGSGNTKDSGEKPASSGTPKPTPQPKPTGHMNLNIQNAPTNPSDIPAGTKFYDAKGGFHRWEGNMWTTLNDQKKWQSGIIDNKTAFAQFLDAVKANKAFIPKNVQGGNTQPNRTEDIRARLLAALEAEKTKPIKARDPSAQTLNDLRKSGAMGAHKDKKKLAKQGYSKHKGKIAESYTKVEGMDAEKLRRKYAKDWEIRKGKYLYKKVAFDDYNTVLRFLMVIEKPQIELDHFADIKFFYNEAELVVYTHDAKGLTTNDFKLAVQIDRALDRMGAKEIG